MYNTARRSSPVATVSPLSSTFLLILPFRRPFEALSRQVSWCHCSSWACDRSCEIGGTDSSNNFCIELLKAMRDTRKTASTKSGSGVALSACLLGLLVEAVLIELHCASEASKDCRSRSAAGYSGSPSMCAKSSQN
uniref:Uncharacterized protein n=1 Tax=Trypanosoma congolense (strain IL3000) TaxID=1068625 RepID=G0V084_TRYCI|nr:hypothetical protein, unlikely [Trypanosoma congolense IL3000]